MNRFLILILMITVLTKCARNTEREADNSTAYFALGELSHDPFTDSVRNALYSKTLQALEEKTLRGSPEIKHSYRLTVFPSHYNAYCVRVDNMDTVTTVTFKVVSDRKDFVRAGLRDLTLTYKSEHSRMDSLFRDLDSSFKGYDFYPGFDEVDFVAADGITYLLESFSDGEYKVVQGWDAGSYKGKEDLLRIVRKMHSFIPGGLLPDLRNAKNLEDVLFIVFRRDSL